MTAAVIETHELRRGFDGFNALESLSIDVRAGEVLALLGPNGAGKTTTIRLLNGVLQPDSGDSTVLGMDPSRDGDAVRRRTGVLTEQAGLEERLTAIENLVVTARIRKLPLADAQRRGLELLDRFGMGHRAHTLVRGFSTGQRKRVAMARALLHEPEVLFLDEPTSGLDPEAIRDVLDLISDLAVEGRTIVLCTHFLGEADRLAHRMAVLIEGRLRAFGSTAELARSMWTGMAVDLEVALHQLDVARAAAKTQAGVLTAEFSGSGLALRVEDRDVIPSLLARLAEASIAVYSVVPRPATLEDVYFKVLDTIAQDAA